MSVSTEIVAGVHLDLRTRMAEVSLADLRREAESRSGRRTPNAVDAAMLAAGRRENVR